MLLTLDDFELCEHRRFQGDAAEAPISTMALCTARQISTMTWKATGVLIVFLLALVAESTLSLPTFMTVILNDPITLPFSGLCHDGVIEWRRYQDGPSGGIIKKTVAELDREVLTSGEGYENRVELQNGNLSLTISSAEYNDMGWYECVCNNNTNVLHDVKLEVLVPTKISAHVGENVTLHCHGRTDSQINFHWQKDVQTSVLKVEIFTLSSNAITTCPSLVALHKETVTRMQ
uniref:Immunoglobulin domain-containing protein n=1 Tax=Oncorhynchus mykiss TaxID=8022 RepID=A0A8C7W022_ONCMY